ncbi:MAG: ABC transporter permease subunit [Oscillospiraceae bacterium]|nr:ABC transporter permease subunit [Oscillospiraceae bacterium]
MKTKIAAIALLAVLVASLLAGCASDGKEPPADSALIYTGFQGKTIGLLTGTICDAIIEGPVGGTPAFYTEMSAGVEDVRKGRIAGFMTDLSAVNIFCADPGNRDLTCVEIPAEIFSAPMGAVSLDPDMIGRFNVFLSGLKADGTLAGMQGRWLDTVPDLDSPMPEIPLTGKNGTLKVATSAGAMPFAYMGANSELKGYSIELIRRFAADQDMQIAYAEMEFGAMIPCIVSGKADIAIANISITEERKKSVLFTDPVCDDRLGIITAANSPADAGGALDYTAFAGKRFAVKNGTIYDGIATELMEASEKLLFEDYASIYEAIQKGKADAALRNYYAAQMSLLDSEYTDLTLTVMPMGVHKLEIAAISMDQDVIDSFNAFLAALRADGTYDQMKTRWFDEFDPGALPDMPEIPLSGGSGTLTIAISSDYMPYSFLGADGVNLGFDIELGRRFAAYINKDIAFVDMAFSGLLPYVISGKADIAISDITITEERKQSVLFTDPYFADMSAVIYKRGPGGEPDSAGGGGAIEWVKKGIERNLITENRWKMIVNGLLVTMVIALAAQLFGTALGGFVCWVLTRRSRLVKWLGNVYCGLIHGTPAVVLLLIAYYIVFGSASISNVLVAAAAFTMVMGAGIAQTLKGAIETVDPVEIEAARSIGFSAFGAFRAVTLPQAVRRALPGYTGGFVELVKATAVVG